METTKLERIKAKRGKKLLGRGAGAPEAGGGTPKGTCNMKGEKA